ncbi:hypothetical protein Tco_0505522 [Tanacetum coccineum]
MQIAQPGMNMRQDRQMQMVGGNGGNLFEQYTGKLIENHNRYNVVQSVGNQVVQNAVQNSGVQNVRNQNGLIVVSRIANQNANQNRNGLLCNTVRNYTVKPRRRDVAYLHIQLLITQKEESRDSTQSLEFELMPLRRGFLRDQEADESLAKHKALELEIERLLRAVVSHDIMSIVLSNSVVDTSNLQTELDRTKEKLENCIIKKEKEYAVLWNNWYTKCEE